MYFKYKTISVYAAFKITKTIKKQQQTTKQVTLKQQEANTTANKNSKPIFKCANLNVAELNLSFQTYLL